MARRDQLLRLKTGDKLSNLGLLSEPVEKNIKSVLIGYKTRLFVILKKKSNITCNLHHI